MLNVGIEYKIRLAIELESPKISESNETKKSYVKRLDFRLFPGYSLFRLD